VRGDCDDFVEHTAHIRFEIYVPDAMDVVAQTIEMLRSGDIRFHLILRAMMRSIEFDNQSSFFAEKIRNVWPARCLPTKFQPIQPAVAQPGP